LAFAGFARRVWAAVAHHGTLPRGSGAMDAFFSGNSYSVTFDTDVSACAYIATVGKATRRTTHLARSRPRTYPDDQAGRSSSASPSTTARSRERSRSWFSVGALKDDRPWAWAPDRVH